MLHIVFYFTMMGLVGLWAYFWWNRARSKAIPFGQTKHKMTQEPSTANTAKRVRIWEVMD
jgi:hypothetical protein